MKVSAFLTTTLLGEVGGRRDEPKAEQKIVIRSRVLGNNCLERLFTQSQVLLSSIVDKSVRLMYVLSSIGFAGQFQRSRVSDTGLVISDLKILSRGRHFLNTKYSHFGIKT